MNTGNKIKRPDRNTYFMVLAYLVSSRGTCEKQRVGCVITKDNRIVATGYNSSAPGTPHCPGVDSCIQDIQGRCRRVLHAEVSAVLSLSRRYDNLIAYVTHEPCSHCYQIMTQAGVSTIYYANEYSSTDEEKAVKYLLTRLIGVEPMKLDINAIDVGSTLNPLNTRYGVQLP